MFKLNKNLRSRIVRASSFAHHFFHAVIMVLRNSFFSLLIFANVVKCSIKPQKFRHWFPDHGGHFPNMIANGTCAAELTNYWDVNDRHSEAHIALCQGTSPCSCVINCLLENTQESKKQNMAAASILLGLTPGILALMGPSVAEIATLSARSPFLAVLLAAASPAVDPIQLFSGSQASSDILGRVTTCTSRRWYAWWSRQSTRIKLLTRGCQVVLALASLANTIHTSIHLDLRSSSTWACNKVFLPLGWSLLSVVVHAVGVIAIHLRKPSYALLSEGSAITPDLTHGSRNKTLQIIRRHDWKPVIHGEDGTAGEILWWSASLGSILHMIFGVLVYSSLLLVAIPSALPILIRYATSAGICQAILLSELAKMRIELEVDAGRKADTAFELTQRDHTPASS